MDVRALENLIGSFLAFKSAYNDQPPRQVGQISIGDKPTRTWSRNGVGFFLQDEPLVKYDAFMAKWNRKPWSTKWSEKYRVDLIQAAILKAWNAEDDGAAAFTEVAAEFDAEPERFSVWLPLGGIDVDVENLQLGSVRIVKLTQARANELLQAVAAINAQTLNSDEVKAQLLQYATQMVQGLLGVTCAEVTTAGDPERSQELAEQACLDIIDVLQFMSGMFVDPDERIRIDFRSFDSSGYRPVLLLSEGRTHFVPSQNRFGASGNFALTQQRLVQFDEWNLSAIFDILSKVPEERSEIELLILRAVHWFADGDLQRHMENKLQSYVTCLDMFFTERGAEVGAAVQDGVAWMMADDAEHRLYLHQFVADVYDFRSRSSHDGAKF